MISVSDTDPNDRWYVSKQYFESNYVLSDSVNRMNVMPFGRATIHAREGLKIARSGWNGSGMYIYIVPARSEENSGPECLDIPYIYYQEYWALKTSSGHISTWAPSVSDSLAEDWVIVT